MPRNLFEQFHPVAYIYFLVIAILNQLAVFGRAASIMPLAFVLLVTAIKDAYEDYRRHRSDKIENNRLAWVLANEQFQQKNGKTYGLTTNLDGESNLKARYAKQETHMKILVYAGGETKAMLNNSGAPSKRSHLETRMNREIVFLSIFLVLLCTVVCIGHGVWLRRHKYELEQMQFYRKKDYSKPEVEKYDYYGWGMEIFFVFLMSVIVFQIMIPISLYISMELVRVGQAYFMIRDDMMLDQSSNSRFQCRALNIKEDLGQIKHVFSDKTGTLTENKMEFQCASVGGLDFSNGKADSENGQVGSLVQVDGIVLRPMMKVKIDLELLKLSKRKYTNEGRLVYDFFVALAACNTIVPLTMETSDPAVKLVEYQGESPDERALVYAAASYGFMLIERTSGHIVIDIQGERQRSFFHIANTKLFWACLVGVTIGALVPRFVVKVYVQNYRPNDIQIAREADKIETAREESHDAQIEMNQIF